MLVTFYCLVLNETGRKWKVDEVDINPESVVSLEDYEEKSVFPDLPDLYNETKFTLIELTNHQRRVVIGDRITVRKKLFPNKSLLQG